MISEKTTHNKYNILIISHRYYPQKNARAFRWASLAEHWASLGHDVDVVSVKTWDSAKQEDKNRVRIYRAADLFSKIRYRLWGNIPLKRINTSAQKSKKSLFRIIKLKLSNILNTFWKTLYWPDKEFLWIMPAYYHSSKLISQKKYDLIITVARPFSSHVVAYLLRRRIKEITWLCDIGDPFSFDKDQKSNNLFLYSKLNRLMERKIFLNCDKVSVTTDETAYEYIKHLILDEAKFITIPPLFSLNSRPSDKKRYVQNEIEPQNDTKKLFYFGSLYDNIRNPLFLLNLIKEHNTIFPEHAVSIYFFGRHHDCIPVFNNFENALGNWIFLKGQVDRALVKPLMSEADILVNIGNRTTYQLPSKIIEYISTGKPVLNISSVKLDSSEQALTDYPLSLTIKESERIDSNTLEKLHKFLFSSHKIEKRIIDNILEKHSLESLSKQYLNLIKS